MSTVESADRLMEDLEDDSGGSRNKAMKGGGGGGGGGASKGVWGNAVISPIGVYGFAPDTLVA